MKINRTHQGFLSLISIVVDSVFFFLSISGVYYFRFFSGFFESPKGIPEVDIYLLGATFILPIHLLLIHDYDLYNWGRNSSLFDEIPAIIKIAIFTLMAAASLAFFVRNVEFSRSVFLMLFIAFSVGLILSRLLQKLLIKKVLPKNFSQLDCIIIGSGETFERIKSHPLTFKNKYITYLIKSFFHLDTVTIKEIRKTIHEAGILRIFFTPEITQHEKVFSLLKEFEGENIEIAILPDQLEFITSKSEFKLIGGLPFYLAKDSGLTTFDMLLKRIFDFIFSGFLLISISPILIGISLVIKFSSPGPILFKQIRVGRNGKEFNCYKFRSMVVDAEVKTGPIWAQKDDPRVTSIGKILRRFSLDELPQLWNVFRGDMSLVGPRPERPHFVNQFKGFVPKYNERHRLKAGMTGWAQVNGLRQDATIEERTKYDVYYIENWSLWFDIKILLMTISVVLFGDDAY